MCTLIHIVAYSSQLENVGYSSSVAVLCTNELSEHCLFRIISQMHRQLFEILQGSVEHDRSSNFASLLAGGSHSCLIMFRMRL